jgi:hypothetical protein
MTRHIAALATFALITGCQQAAKAPVHDTFTKVESDSAKTTIASIAYGKTSSPTKVRANSYGWLQFAGNRGDDVSVSVHSGTCDSVAFILDANDDVVASNDDGSDNGDAKVTATLAKDGTYYIAFRDYGYGAGTFTVTLQGSGVFTCAVDSDCVAVPQAGCCDNGYKAAVSSSRTEDYDALYACDQSSPICSHRYVLDTRVAICDFTASTCAMIDPSTIHCGGFINPNHACPDGWTCQLGNPDVGGTCVKQAE